MNPLRDALSIYTQESLYYEKEEKKWKRTTLNSHMIKTLTATNA